jgi:ubiquitin-conjugating enzyme E2 Q
MTYCLICGELLEAFDIDVKICGQSDCEYQSRTLFMDDNFVFNFINDKKNETILILDIAKYAINNPRFTFSPMPKYPGCDVTIDDIKEIFNSMNIKQVVMDILKMKSDLIAFDAFGIIKYGLIKYLIKSNLMEIKSNKLFLIDNIETYEVSYFDEDLANFDTNAKSQGTSYLYHGSSYANWYSIMMNGLKVYSNTPQMVNGASYGNGIYLSNNFATSFGYSCKKLLNANNYKITKYLVGVFQTIGDIKKYEKCSTIYVVDDPKILKLKYILCISTNFINTNNILDTKFNNLLIQEQQSKKTYMTSFRNKRLLKEVNYVTSGKCEEFGLSFVINENNFYIWNVYITNIDTDSLLFTDMQKLQIKSIHMEIRFPPQYPLQPPFIRVISPIFQFMTGHITSGGSICIELLTNGGWSPSYNIENVLIQIKATILENGRLDFGKIGKSYSFDEAQIAFRRMLISHGWQ